MGVGVDMGLEIEGTLIKDQNSFWSMSDDDLIEFLKKDLQITRWDKAIIEGVPEDKVKILEKWINKNKGKIEGVEVSIKPTLTGLTVEEEETFEMEYRAELDCNRVQLCVDEIEKFQRYNEPDCPEEWKPLRLEKKLKWWKQKLEKAEVQDKINDDRLKRENEATKENKKTAKKLEDALPILEKHSHIGKRPRKHELLLDEQIDLFDQGLTERNEGVQQPSGKVLIRFKKYLKEKKEELKTKIDIEEIEDEYDCLKWRYPDGRTGKQIRWSGFPQRLKRIRDRRKK